MYIIIGNEQNTYAIKDDEPYDVSTSSVSYNEPYEPYEPLLSF